MSSPQPDYDYQHHLQLFDSSKSLVETVGAFLLTGFDQGEALLVVATPEHRELLSRWFEESDLNVRAALRANRLTILDAAQTLDKFMRQDTPSPVAFAEVVGTLVARLGTERRVRIYGEMVDVLATRGNYKGAGLLEVLWNDLGRRE